MVSHRSTSQVFFENRSFGRQVTLSNKVTDLKQRTLVMNKEGRSLVTHLWINLERIMQWVSKTRHSSLLICTDPCNLTGDNLVKYLFCDY